MEHQVILRQQIKWLSARMNPLYWETAEERKTIVQKEWVSDNDPILMEMEVTTTFIVGYLHQIGDRGTIGKGTQVEIDKALYDLETHDIFQVEQARDWYFSEGNDHPNLQRYIYTLDYARRLAIAYLNGIQVGFIEQPVS